MEKVTVGAKLSNMEEPVKVQIDLPQTVTEAIEFHNGQGLNGEDIVFSRYMASLIIDLQAYMRGAIKANKTPEEIQALVDAWKPGTKAKGKSPAEKMRDLFGKLSAEEREEVLAELGLS